MTRLSGLISVCLLVASTLSLSAKEPVTETREFAVRVDGKPAGSFRLVVQEDESGKITVAAQADVRVRYLVYNYVYQFRGTEIWKDGKLDQLESNTTDDKKQFAVQAWNDGKDLHIKSNGVERLTRPDVWTSTYWRLPEARFRNQPVPLIDVDTGKDIRASLQYVGVNSVKVNGELANCSHYRVVGSVQVDLWYDSQDRLVRQESVEEGHRTLLELVRMGR